DGTPVRRGHHRRPGHGNGPHAAGPAGSLPVVRRGSCRNAIAAARRRSGASRASTAVQPALILVVRAAAKPSACPPRLPQTKRSTRDIAAAQMPVQQRLLPRWLLAPRLLLVICNDADDGDEKRRDRR